jgi:hypothetical protein
LLELLERCASFPRREEDDAKVIARFEVLRIQFDRPRQGSFCFRAVSLLQENLPQQVVRASDRRIIRNRLLERLRCFRNAPGTRQRSAELGSALRILGIVTHHRRAPGNRVG